ncbi:MAG TPA: flagellar protein FlaF [Rhodospirillales bacterium]|nr:flagellar protein FlaF [Rhodospirillales bacterium]
MYKKNLMKSYATPPLEGNPREVEAWALTQAALRMKDAKEAGDHDAMLAAARLNWRLWTIFQAELLSPECTVPDDIRSNVLSLSNFIDKHTLDFISNVKPERLDILISINRELAGGLYAKPRQAEENEENPEEPVAQIAKTGETLA